MRSVLRAISIVLVVLFVIMIPVNIVLNMFDNTLSLLFKGNSFWELENKDSTAFYFSDDYNGDETARLEAGNDLCYRVEAEGAVLLYNNGALPLAEGSKVSTLSSNSVNLVYGGTGSGNVDASKALDLKEALEQSGLEVNPTLWKSYFKYSFFQKLFKLESDELLYDRSSSAGESAVLAGQAGIAEAPVYDSVTADGKEIKSHYTKDIEDSLAVYGDAAIITFSRIGGEGYDCAFPGYVDNSGNVSEDNYLALSSVERDLLNYATSLRRSGVINNVIILLNCSNSIQLDFFNEKDENGDLKYAIDAMLWVGGLGISGTEAVADILVGKVNPSGSLADTYLYNNLSSPAMLNYLAQSYELNDGVEVPDAISTYMVYQEGIYVGYKYYETRYEDFILGRGNAGEFDYSAEVAFPFGHGLSYTSFSYDMTQIKYITGEKKGTIDFVVTVTNTGNVAGKETVQIYGQSPYTQYDIDNKIEKAAVQLVGFGKTGIIEPGASETVTINVDMRDMASYDAYGAGTYILEAGDYYFTAATDSHNAIDNILAKKGWNVGGNEALVYSFTYSNDYTKAHIAGVDAVTYSTSLNGTEITNQLNSSDPNVVYGAGTVTFLTRNDWKGTMPTGEGYKLYLTAEMAKQLDNRYDGGYYDEFIAELEAKTGKDWHVSPLFDQNNGLTLYDMKSADYDEDGITADKDYNDPAWNKLLENISIDDLVAIGDCFHWRHPVEGANAPGSRDENGPQGLTVALFGSGLDAEATAFPSEDVMAATFSKDLAREIGLMIGNDCIAAGVSCLYGPGANTHRTPYGGRNFEYYSEDGFLAGEIGYYEINAILEKGVDVVMKHFALNDTEQNRLGQAAWLTEQAAREIYLKAFQKSLEENGGRGGIMTAYTRWGFTWSGANYGLMTGILREEWGNNSMHITDNMITPNCNAIDAVMAGGVTCFDAMMTYAVDDLKTATEDPIVLNAMVEAVHHNLYTIINSAAMNGVGPDTQVKAITPAILVAARVLTAVFGVLGLAGIIVFRKRTFRMGYFF